MSLLFLASRLARERGYQVAAAHVNHGLRGEANLDEQLVVEVCRQHSIPCYTTGINLTQIPAVKRQGTEADARNLRYQALMQIAKDIGAAAIFLGHHAGDQVETLYWRLMRGTSLRGLGGIRPVRVEQGIYFVRPLLELTKQNLHRFAVKLEIPFREDATNYNLDYTRNFIRHELIPRMQTIQPNLFSIIGRTASLLQEDESFLQEQSQAVLTSCTQRVDNRYLIDLTCFLGYPRPLQRRVIKIILYCLASEDWSFVHVESILDLCASPKPSAQISLPAGLAVWREYHRLWLGSAAELSPEGDSLGSIPEVNWVLEDGMQLVWPKGQSLLHLPQWTFICRDWTATQGYKRDSAFELVLPKVSGVLVRRVQTDERMTQLGMKGTKKIQDIFTDTKVPKSMRSIWPGFYLEDRLVWLPGLRRSREFLVQSGEQSGWLISAEKTG